MEAHFTPLIEFTPGTFYYVAYGLLLAIGLVISALMFRRSRREGRSAWGTVADMLPGLCLVALLLATSVRANDFEESLKQDIAHSGYTASFPEGSQEGEFPVLLQRGDEQVECGAVVNGGDGAPRFRMLLWQSKSVQADVQLTCQ